VGAVQRDGFERLDPQSLSNTLNALAKLNHHPGEAWLQELVEECLRTDFAMFDSQALAITLNGLTRLGHHPGDAFLERLKVAALAKLLTFTPQHLANTLNGFARLDWNPGNLWLVRQGLSLTPPLGCLL
jgi:hypothetical protein